MLSRLLFYAVTLFIFLPLSVAAEKNDVTPQRIPFPIPGRTDDAGWETKIEENEEEESLIPPALLDEPIRQTAAMEDNDASGKHRAILPEVHSDLRPRYLSVRSESASKTIPVQRLTPKEKPKKKPAEVFSKPEIDTDVPFDLPTPLDAPQEKKTEDSPIKETSFFTAKEVTSNGAAQTFPSFYTVNNVSDETVDDTGCLPFSTNNFCGPTGGYKTQKEFFVDGWFQGGILHNPDLPCKSNTTLLYNDRNSEAVLNQFYLSLGRSVNQKQSGFDIGGRIDLLYGTDYFYTSSLGLETKQTEYIFGEPVLDPLDAVLRWNSNKGSRRLGTAALYGLSIPQAYAEIHFPFARGVTVKAGHFYSGMGLESAMSAQNFFYSHSYSFMYGNPTTLTGGTITAQLNPRMSVMFGFTQGWNVFAKPRNGVSGIAGLTLTGFDRSSTLSFVLHSGEESLRDDDKRSSYSLTYRKQLSPMWSYALEHTYGYEKNGVLFNSWTGQRDNAHWVSLAQYLQWKWSDTLTFGARFEWFRDDGHSRVQKSPVLDPGYRELSGKDYYALTLGANWQPVHYVTVRPEIRYDWSNVRINGQQGVYSGNTKQSMLSFGIDGIIRF